MALDANAAHDALYQALETELAAVAVYEAALGCAVHDELRDEWQRFREAKREFGRELAAAVRSLALDADVQTASRHVARHLGQSLVAAIKMAAQSASPVAAEGVAAECIAHIEAASRQRWMLVERVAKSMPGEAAAALRALAHRLEPEQEAHIERAERWRSELALKALGLPAVIPLPPAHDALAAAVPSLGGAPAWPEAASLPLVQAGQRTN